MPGNLIDRILAIFPPLFNWLHARELRKGEERDRNEEQRLIEIITLEQDLVNRMEQLFPDSKETKEFTDSYKKQIEFYKEQLKEVQARLRR